MAKVFSIAGNHLRGRQTVAWIVMRKIIIGSYFGGYLLSAALLMGAVSSLQGCGGNAASDASPTDATVNDVYYQSLAANNHLSHALAQAPTELFVPVKHFDLVQDTRQMLPAATATVPHVVYRPAHALGAQAKPQLLASASVADQIPGVKPLVSFPAACQGLAEEELKTCMEDATAQSTPLADPYMSYFDEKALGILLGDDFANALASKVIDSKLGHIDSATRAQVLSKLSDYINDAPAHQSLDLVRYNIFERSGFYLSGVSFTDTGRGDVDGDGVLDPHSTMIVQLSKKLDYARSGQSELDTILQKVHGQLPVETYLVNLQVFIHLKDLSSVRQRVMPLPNDPAHLATVDEELAQLNREAEATWINKAMDANILKKIVESPDLIPWASSEYVLSFQVSPDNITEHLAPAMAAVLESGDLAAAQVIEQHINAQTAIMTGASNVAVQQSALAGNPSPVKVFYQVTQPQFGSAMSSSSAAGLEYGMYDAAGNRVAIMDPTSSAPILAGESAAAQTQSSALRKIAMTKRGACGNTQSDWAYWPSRVRTNTFGRGINWILTESLLHNQVGDYKNIHWYQSVWKSSAQVGIKSSMWVLANYLKVQFGGAGISQNKEDYVVYYVLEVLMPYLNSFLSDQGKGQNGRVFKIAGYSYAVDSKIIRFVKEAALYGKDATLGQKAGAVIKGAAIGFLIDRAADGVGQTLDVTVTGWQDYSDGSHYGCFKFDY